MPCTVDNFDAVQISESALDALHSKAESLQRELCRTQRLVIELAGLLELRDPDQHMTKRLEEAIQRTKRKWRHHREYDKQRAVKEAKGPVDIIIRQIRSITEMGGLPGPDLNKKLEDARRHLASVTESDPLTTKLY